MARPSSVDRLPEGLRNLIAEQRAGGRTIEELRAELRAGGVSVSRSALGRHIKKLDADLNSPELRCLRADLVEIKGMLQALLAEIRQPPRRCFFI